MKLARTLLLCIGLVILCDRASHAQPLEEITTRKQFLDAAKQSPDWWDAWGNGARVANDLRPKSAILRNVLETSYKVRVPFGPALSMSVVDEAASLANTGKPKLDDIHQQWCGSVAMIELARVVAAKTVAIAPELVAPNEDPTAIRRWAPEHEKRYWKSLHTYCDRVDDGQLTRAFLEFVADYEKVIAARFPGDLLASQQRQAQAQADVASKFEEQQRLEREAELRVKVQRQKEEILQAERLTQERRQREAARIKQEEVAANQRAIREEAEAARVDGLRKGRIPPQTIDDWALKMNASNGAQIVMFPPIVGDRKLYKVAGRLIRSEGTLYIFEILLQSDRKYFGVAMTEGAFKESGFELRYETCASVVGLFARTDQYTTISGTQRAMPVFLASGLGKCS